MNTIIVIIDEQGNVRIDTNKLKMIERTKYIVPFLKAIGREYIGNYFKKGITGERFYNTD